MHYRQTILDAAVTALNGTTSLAGRVTDKNAFPAEVDADTPYARVLLVSEERDEAQDAMSTTTLPRMLTLRVNVLIAGSDVQRQGNAVLEEVEGVLPAALKPVSDCTWFDEATFDVAADQDRETYNAQVDWSVYYVTDLGDPSTRV